MNPRELRTLAIKEEGKYQSKTLNKNTFNAKCSIIKDDYSNYLSKQEKKKSKLVILFV